MQLKQDEIRASILREPGNALIMGGPGSGKTTIALFKAQSIVEAGMLKPGQKVLFLSFARATISRIEEQAGSLISKDAKRKIEINTYHGFIWNVLKNHGYLLCDHPLRLWPPHEAAAKLSNIPPDQVEKEKYSAFVNQGLVHFDLFARLCNDLFQESKSLHKVYSSTYPVIILDEFQDTNHDEWELIKTLGIESTLIALADPEQRIYDFRGADPKRISLLIEYCNPRIFDFGQENNRSTGTDIAQYGNDLLTGNNKGREYKDVKVYYYPIRRKPLNHAHLKYNLLTTCNRLKQQKPDAWSIAVLVPSNALMVEISDYLQRVQPLTGGKQLPSIPHEVAIETAGPSLAAVFLGTLLEGNCTEKALLTCLINHIAGRRGNKPATREEANLISALEKYCTTGIVVGKKRKTIVEECKCLIKEVGETSFSGNIISDWRHVASLIGEKESACLKQIASDLKYLRLLQRGSQLYSSFDELWRNSHSYKGAVDAISSALTQEHFSLSARNWNGINVMTIHKAKGKEFDAVILYEGRFQGRYVSNSDRIDQAKLNLRVAVTRARSSTLIMTPEEDPCPLL